MPGASVGKWLVLVPLFLGGCEALEALQKTEVDNPVLGPPPPRYAAAQVPHSRSEYINDPLQPQVNGIPPGESLQAVAFTQKREKTTPYDVNELVATVNGEPIFAGEVLEQAAEQLEKVRAQAEQLGRLEEYQTYRRQLLQKLLKTHIENRLLVIALKNTLEAEQLEKIDEALNKMFAPYVERLMKDMKVDSQLELEQELANRGTSLAGLRFAFANVQMAETFMDAKAHFDRNISRPELLAYYEAHLDEYAINAKAKWQQISISFDKHGGRKPALPVLERAVQELRQGADFGDVARRHSDGPAAHKGGDWDWTQAGSLSNKEIEQVLFELPVGTISRVIIGDGAFRLVKVNDRTPAGYVPFAEVQEEIKQKVLEESRRKARQAVLDELYANAVIQTIFDDEE